MRTRYMSITDWEWHLVASWARGHPGSTSTQIQVVVHSGQTASRWIFIGISNTLYLHALNQIFWSILFQVSVCLPTCMSACKLPACLLFFIYTVRVQCTVMWTHIQVKHFQLTSLLTSLTFILWPLLRSVNILCTVLAFLPLLITWVLVFTRTCIYVKHPCQLMYFSILLVCLTTFSGSCNFNLKSFVYFEATL